MKKLFTLMIAAAMLLTCLASCATEEPVVMEEKETTTKETEKEPQENDTTDLSQFISDKIDEFTQQLTEEDKALIEDIANNLTEEDAALLEELTKEQLQELSDKRDQFLADIAAAFEGTNLGININEATGEILLDSAVLFAFDSAEISEEGQNFLRMFFDIYSSVVLDSEYADFVCAVMVEGHTDTNGGYDMNKALSERRANAVKDFCVESNPEYAEELSALLQAVGYSYDNPIYDEDGNVDMDASRRVSFRFIIDLKSVL